MNQQYSQETLDFLSSTDLEDRNALGQYFTPKFLRSSLLKHLNFQPGDKVLDPGVGTGEFLKDILLTRTDLQLEGWDIDPKVLKFAKKLLPGVRLKVRSALEYKDSEKGTFDFVIGNPPYFEIKDLSPKQKLKYKSVIGGRPNIFALFFKVGLDLLKPGGTLAYVVPPSMNNGAYFNKLREFIIATGDVKSIEIFNSDLFIDAQTSVMIIVIQKGPNLKSNFIDLSHKSSEPRIIFSPQVSKLKKEFKGKATISDLGYEVRTGSCIWNENVNNLYDAPAKDRALLIYSHNIVNNKIALSTKKKQYIKTASPLKGKALVVNRVTGGVGKGELKCALIKKNLAFLGENHVNVILADPTKEQLVTYEELYDLLTSPAVKERVRIITGNTQISAKELAYFLPLDYALDKPSQSKKKLQKSEKSENGLREVGKKKSPTNSAQTKKSFKSRKSAPAQTKKAKTK